jgi:hypothetical protein
MSLDLRTLVCEELDVHESVTRIVYTDTDDRVEYQCSCGESSSGTVLTDQEWKVAHTTDVVMTILSSVGIDNRPV